MHHCALNPIPTYLWFCFFFLPLSSAIFLFTSVPWAVTGNGSCKAASLQQCRALPSESRFPLPPRFCTRRGPSHRKQPFLQNNACNSSFPCAVSLVQGRNSVPRALVKEKYYEDSRKKLVWKQSNKMFEIPRPTMTVNKASGQK